MYMENSMRKVIKRLLGRRITQAIKILLHGVPEDKENHKCFAYDLQRFVRYSAATNPKEKESMLAKIVVRYHVLEKGLTMPNRRLGFGINIAKELLRLIAEYESICSNKTPELVHAIAVIREYWAIHEQYSETTQRSDVEFWQAIRSFSDAHRQVQPAIQPHSSRKDYYSSKNAPFPEFAWSRHTLRHYANSPLPIERITAAINVARSTPSACNRQHCRTHVLSDKQTIEKLLAIQAGNRGFGCYADKLLVVTSDLQCVIGENERNDIYLNGGMYLMNLCYALHYYEVAHCILNWSKFPEEDVAAREFLNIRPSETIIALLSCGETPEEFDIAESPRKTIEDYIVVH